MRYDVVDVFTDRPYTGNPLAVVHGGDALSTEQMQAIASEFNLSETTFPLPPTQPGADYRLRIFTPARELPFAGHPSVGTSWVLARDGVITPGERVQECAAGLLPVLVDADGARITGGPPTVGGPVPDVDALAAAVGLSAGDVDNSVPAGLTGAGVDYLFLVVRPDAVARAVPDASAITALAPGAVGLAVCALSDGATRVHLRMFAPASGVAEDPATGSAAVALGVFLAGRGLAAPDGTHAFTIGQGIEMGRPSVLHATVTCSGGAVVSTTVAGGVVAVGRGELIALPAG